MRILVHIEVEVQREPEDFPSRLSFSHTGVALDNPKYIREAVQGAIEIAAEKAVGFLKEKAVAS